MKPETLAEYLAASGRTQFDLASELGISIAAMSKIVRGLTMPRPALALRIHELTGVPLEAMIRARANQDAVA